MTLAPPSTFLRTLRALAKLYGIQPAYTNVMGERKTASAKSLMGALRARKADVESEASVDQALADREEEQRARTVEPVTVWWGERGRRRLCIRSAAEQAPAEIPYRLELEDGSKAAGRLAFAGSKKASPSVSVYQLPREQDLPFGYHSLTIDLHGREAKSRIFVAPQKGHSPPELSEDRHWGVFAPVYALRSEKNWGIGDLADATNLLERSADLGSSFLSALPLLASFLEEPFDPSPYAPVSRLFWNEIFLPVGEIPELARCARAREILVDAAFQDNLERLRSMSLVNHREVMKSKRRVLELLADEFFASDTDPARRASYEDLLTRKPEIREYAAFRAYTDAQRMSWYNWPETQRRGTLSEADVDERAVRYHLYVQWLIDERVKKLAGAARARGLGLYLDFPLGTHPDGFDGWKHQHLFAEGTSVGAPPDIAYRQGQDWGFHPLDPDASRASGHSYWIACIRHQLQCAGLLRIDHVMSLHRLYWVPSELGPDEGVYVRYPAEEFYAGLCIESLRHKSVIIGEDLGTVPSYVRSTMARRGQKRLFVLQRQLTHVKENPPGEIRPEMVTSLNNHDMPPFGSFWQGLDIMDRQELGWFDEEMVARTTAARAEVRRKFTEVLERRGLLGGGELDMILRGSLQFLAGSASELLVVTLEDLWLELKPQNTPTTVHERPNWRRKMKLSIDEIFSAPSVRGLLEMVNETRKADDGGQPKITD